MASDERDQRQAMRQRGAGTRNVDNPEFDLDFTTGSREERRLMRQRGAGNREVNNIDFGFAFATPIHASSQRARPRSKTPRTTARTPLKRNSDNVALPAAPMSSARSTRSHDVSSAIPRSARGLPSAQHQRKRRRLSEVSNITRATSLDIPTASELGNLDVPHVESSHRSPAVLSLSHGQRYHSSRYDVPSSPQLLPDHIHDEIEANKENEPTLLESKKPVTKKRKRKSIGQQSLFKRKRSSGSASTPLQSFADVGDDQEPLQSQPEGVEISSGNEPALPLDHGSEQPRIVAHPPVQRHDIQDLTSSNKTKRRKKRRSIVAGKKKKRVSGTASPLPNPSSAQHTEPGSDEVFRDTVENRHAFDVRLDDREPSLNNDPVSPQPVFDRNVSEDPGRLNAHDGEEGDETYVPDDATPEPTPAPKRARIQNHSKTSSGRSSSARGKKDGVPILTHRITNAYALPTITEDVEPRTILEDGQFSRDELSLAPPPPTIITRSTPNAIDVLAQACRETIDASIQKLKSDASRGSRANASVQVNALQTFRSNLDIRLFDVSQSLDQRLHMEARLRKSRREKAELQARWLAVRKERDVMALRMDAVRRQNWEDEALAQKAWDISQAAHKMDATVDRDDDLVDQGDASGSIEFALKELSQDVSSSDGGGILNILKQFNVQLKQVATLLN